jgi:DNA/RNA-binding domain of Phe-tRNA-synthetase-like protein
VVQKTIGGVSVELEIPEILAGVVVVRGAKVAPSGPALEAEIQVAVGAAKAGSPDTKKAVVRDMLRNGRYKPTGRGKPASEYLDQAAREDRFPRLNNLVDIINLISLGSLLPISLVDLRRAESASFRLRLGKSGEAYVFNAGGQLIELFDLLLLAILPADRPCANPVKDSMLTKLTDDSEDVMAVIYAPRSMQAELRQATDALAAAFTRHAPGVRVDRETVP